jgi:hypothetical protein
MISAGEFLQARATPTNVGSPQIAGSLCADEDRHFPKVLDAEARPVDAIGAALGRLMRIA